MPNQARPSVQTWFHGSCEGGSVRTLTDHNASCFAIQPAGGGSRFSYGKEKECNELDDTEAHQRPYGSSTGTVTGQGEPIPIWQPPKKQREDRPLDETLVTPLNKKSGSKSQATTISSFFTRFHARRGARFLLSRKLLYGYSSTASNGVRTFISHQNDTMDIVVSKRSL